MLGWIVRGILLCTIFILVFRAVPTYGQDKYIIQHYTNENGLPANGLKGIELDKESGFLWVGTQAGLVRFDGVKFKNFSAEKNSAVSRTLLLAKNREGVIYYEDDNFRVYRTNSNRPEFVMTDTLFYPFYQSESWQSIYQSVNQIKERLKNHRRSSFLPFWAVFHDESGNSRDFSFAHFGKVYHYSATVDSLYCFPHYNDILKLGREVFFLDSLLRFWHFNDTLKKPVQVPVTGMPSWNVKKGIKPYFIWKPGMEAPLLFWKQDIWKLQRQGQGLQLQPLCSSCCPPNAGIDAAQLWEERGMIFLSSPINGLYVVKTPFLRSIRFDTTTDVGQVEYAQAEMTDGIVTTASGLRFSTQGQLLPRTIPPFHSSTIYRDQYGDHWFHSADTVIHYHRQQLRYTKIPLRDGCERMIFTELGSRLLVLSDRAFGEITDGQYRLLFKLPYLEGELKNWLNPDAVVEWQPGILAIATEKLLLFDTQKRTAPDSIKIPGLTVKVRALHKYGDYLLIGTYGQGFYMYKNGIVKKMPLDKNGYLSYVHCFMADTNGFYWISTNHGLFKVSLKALVAAYENNLSELYYHYFGKDDGMYNTELNGGCQPCALPLSNGLFSFPSMNGMVLVNTLQQHTPPPAGQIFIEEILADSVSCRFNDGSLQALPYDVKNLRFRIALPQFGNLENVYFSYKLEPYNDAWETQSILQNNTLQFGGLPPGDYTLYVRVRNGFGPDEFGISKISFHILKPWYQAWWFLILCLLGFVTMTWALVKWRTARIARRKEELQLQVAMQTKQLEEQLQQLQRQQLKLEDDNKVKARLIGIISHDMISPIRFMAFLSKKLRDTFSPNDPSYEAADAFVNVAHELESLSINMLNWIRFHHDANEMQPERFNLRHLVEESTEIAAILAKEKGVYLYNEVPEDAFITQYRQAVGVIIYNLAMNAMKYTEAGNILISGRFTGNGFSLVVMDTGKGMPADMVNQLNSPDPVITEHATGEVKKFQFGYLIIKDLLQLTQGEMLIESALNKGTKVTLQLIHL